VVDFENSDELIYSYQDANMGVEFQRMWPDFLPLRNLMDADNLAVIGEKKKAETPFFS
jgi:hypothetical protein